MILDDIYTAVVTGKAKQVQTLVEQALNEGVAPSEVMDKALIAPMGEIGDKFRDGKIFVPEMLVASRAMSRGLKVLEPYMNDGTVKPLGTVVIGTVKQDLHDIGKNLVATMMRGVGATVYDLGIDVPDKTFVEKAEEVHADVVAISALLTTTMPAIRDVIAEFENAGVRDKYIIMIGGAPVNEAYAKEVKADYYTENASEAAEVLKQLLEKKYSA
jgi:5-methyltetrahydrofolate--homocysteine methyltransferase